MVLVLARQDTELLLILILFQTNHAFGRIVVSQLGLEEHFDGQVADHFGGGKIGQTLLVHAHPDEEIQEDDNKRWRENKEREDIRHRPREKMSIELAHFATKSKGFRHATRRTVWHQKKLLPVIVVRHHFHEEPFAELHAKIPKLPIVILGNEDGRNRDIGCVF